MLQKRGYRGGIAKLCGICKCRVGAAEPGFYRDGHSLSVEVEQQRRGGGGGVAEVKQHRRSGVRRVAATGPWRLRRSGKGAAAVMDLQKQTGRGNRDVGLRDGVAHSARDGVMEADLW